VSGQDYSVGLHPWHVKASSLEEDISKVRDSAKSKQVVAIGETGLDKTIKVPMELQQEAFSAQIEIAVEYNKPVIIHCVRAYNEILSSKLLSKHNAPWIVHWFNASFEMGEQLIRKNFYLSFGHMLFNSKSKAYNAFQKVPDSHIFFETDDAGYTIDEVYRQAALLKNIKISKLERQIILNFTNCFGIEP
jgi:TatD DNase family protein